MKLEWRWAKRLPIIGFNKKMRFSHELQTPTFAFTTIAVLSIMFRHVLDLHFLELMAFLFSLLAAGGVAISLASEVRDKKHEWGWNGLYQALRKPTKQFFIGFFAHLPQLLLALGLAFTWWRKKK